MRACLFWSWSARIFKQYPTHGSAQLVIDKQRLICSWVNYLSAVGQIHNWTVIEDQLRFKIIKHFFGWVIWPFEHSSDLFLHKHCLILLWKFEPRSHFISRLSMIVRVDVVLNRTVVVVVVVVVVVRDWRFDNLCGSQNSGYSPDWSIVFSAF